MSKYNFSIATPSEYDSFINNKVKPLADSGYVFFIIKFGKEDYLLINVAAPSITEYCVKKGKSTQTVVSRLNYHSTKDFLKAVNEAFYK